MNATINLYVSYPLDLFLEGEGLDARIEEAVGREREGSGAGFGFRDIDFEFVSREARNRAASRVMALGIEGLELRLL